MDNPILVPYKKSLNNSSVSGQYINTDGIRTYTDPDLIIKKSFDGFKCLNYKQLISEARNATTPINLAVQQTVSQSIPLAKCLYNTSLIGSNWVPTEYTYWALPYTYNPVLNSSIITKVKAGAIGKLNRAIYNFQKPLQSQILVGEIRETLKFLRNPLTQTSRLSKAFRRKYELAKVKNALHEASASWLEFRFAVLPILADITSILEILEKQQGFFEQDKVSFVEGDNLSTGDYVIHLPNFSLLGNDHVFNKYICSISFGLIASLEPNLRGLTNYLKEDLSNSNELLLTAWELTPWSFLVDYFVNVQDVLLAATHRYESLLSYTSESVVFDSKLISNRDIRSVPGDFQILDKNSNGLWPPTSTFSHHQVQRDVLSSTIPPVSFTLPTGSAQLANIAALVINPLTRN